MIRLKSLLTEAASPIAVSWAKKFKTDLGLTDEAAAAMAANIQHESGFIASRIQGDGIKTGTLSDSGGLGYSWAQWTFGPRKTNFRDHVLNKFKVDIKKEPATNKYAYDFLKHEIVRYPGFDFNQFKTETDINKATADFVTNYEQAGKPMLASRIAIANDILKQIKPETISPAQSYSMKGKTLYPVNSSKHDFTNVRNEPVINNGLVDNIIAVIKWPNPVGVVKADKYDSQNMHWYYVKLPKDVSLAHNYGWVRFDAVTINKNEKYV